MNIENQTCFSSNQPPILYCPELQPQKILLCVICIIIIQDQPRSRDGSAQVQRRIIHHPSIAPACSLTHSVPEL